MTQNHTMYIINYMVSKALKNLYFIFRVTKEFRNIHVLWILYLFCVKSILSYAWPVWSPLYCIDSGKIENVQHKLFRLLSYRSGKGISFGSHNSIFARLTGLHTLNSRRQFSVILFLFEIIFKFVDSKCLFSCIDLNTLSRHHRFCRPFSTSLTINNFIYKSFIQRSCNAVNFDSLVFNLFK